MYDIGRHYDNIYYYLKSKIPDPVVFYLHPFGSTHYENLEWMGDIKNRGPWFVFYDQEPLLIDYNYELFDQIVKSNPFKDPIVLVHTERNSQAAEYLSKQFNFITADYFFHIFAAHDWYRGYQFHSGISDVASRTISKKFISFNRITGNARCYRSFFIAELIENGLLNQGHISYSKTCPDNNKNLTNNLIYAKQHYNVDTAYIAKSAKLLNTIHDLRIDTDVNTPIPNGSMSLGALEACMGSFLHVVSETCFWDKKQHLTEKIFKPILLKQPFVLLGCANNLEYLRSYGFQTFNQYWDESYDVIEDPVQRIQAVVNVIKTICSKSNSELKDILIDMKQILDYNYRKFTSEEFLSSAWIELTTKLDQAYDIQQNQRT